MAAVEAMETPDRKRERDETDVDTAMQELEASLSRDTDMKLKALQTLRDLMDLKDEGYTVQRQTAEAGVLSMLMQLLEDDAESVRVDAAKALTAVTRHSTPTLSRLDVGKSIGFSQTPEKVALNPVQESVTEVEGIFTLLTNMRFGDSADLTAAGTAALTAVCAFNRPNAMAYLHELVHRLLQHDPKALLALEELIAGLDVRDDMAVLLDQAISPTLTFLRSGEDSEKVDAATLLASICEKRPGAAAFLVTEGALPEVAQLLTTDDVSASDTAARLLWLLVKDNRKLLSPARDALGVDGVKLVEPLLALVEAHEDQEDKQDEEKEQQQDKSSSDDEGEAIMTDVTAKAGLAVDNGDDALLLLRALAAQDPDVKDKLKGQSEILGTRCSLM